MHFISKKKNLSFTIFQIGNLTRSSITFLELCHLSYGEVRAYIYQPLFKPGVLYSGILQIEKIPQEQGQHGAYVGKVDLNSNKSNNFNTISCSYFTAN